MSNQRPPGGIEGPTQDPERRRQQASGEPARERGDTSSPTNPPPTNPPPPEPWADQDRTQAYTPRRRSIVERLDRPDHDPKSGEGSTETEPPAPPKSQPPPQVQRHGPKPPGSAQAGARGGRRPLRGNARQGKGLRWVAILVGVVLLGLVAGAAAAWVSGWRPSFLGSKGETPSGPGTDKPPGETPQTKPGDPKPGETPAAPPDGEVARTCYTNITEVKAGAGACGFALDAAGTITFKGAVIAERVAAGSGATQRLMLYPFAPSGRYVFLRACESASGGRCAVQRLADTKDRKMFEVKAGAEGLAWVVWSPKEQVGLLGYRDDATDNVAAIATGDGRTLKAAAIAPGKNRYALVKFGTVRWTGEESFSVEVKVCSFKRGRVRNQECEDDNDVRYRRRTVKIAQ